MGALTSLKTRQQLALHQYRSGHSEESEVVEGAVLENLPKAVEQREELEQNFVRDEERKQADTSGLCCTAAALA